MPLQELVLLDCLGVLCFDRALLFQKQLYLLFKLFVLLEVRVFSCWGTTVLGRVEFDVLLRPHIIASVCLKLSITLQDLKLF